MSKIPIVDGFGELSPQSMTNELREEFVTKLESLPKGGREVVMSRMTKRLKEELLKKGYSVTHKRLSDSSCSYIVYCGIKRVEG